MLIRPVDLQDEPLRLDVILPAKSMEYSHDVRQAGPMRVQGQADLIVEHRGHKEVVEDLRLRAEYKGRFELLCARCLDPLEKELCGDFDLIFRPEDADPDGRERAITEEETEIGYYEKSGLLLEDVVREQVLLSLPSRTLCQQDCKGLCQHCGQNLNIGECQCEKAIADPRWNALADLAGKLKQ